MTKMPSLQKEYGLFINGEWRPASDKATFETKNPATGETLAHCAEATEKDVDDAVRSARTAFKQWKETSPAERAELLCLIADVIDANREHLAMVEIMDNGKPIREALYVDVPESANHFRYFAAAVRAEEGSASMIDGKTLSIILREPIGVAGQIVPWNFPLLMAAWKLAPALAAGCGVVFKPSSKTSLSVLELMRMLEDILPKGLVNIVTGSGSKSGQYLLDHKGLDKLAFTGSTEVGRSVGLAAAEKLIPATLELGGKSANIFFPDCQWDLALEGMLTGILFNQGQACSAGSRVFVHEDIHDRFVEDAVKAFNAVKVGLPWKEDTQMGSIIDAKQLEKVLGWVEKGKQEGATVACGGNRVTDGELGKGCFMRPTLLTGVKNSMEVAREEIFGPVVVVIKFRSEDEVVDMANDSPYGLAGGVWTRDINRAVRIGRAIRTGRMWVNTYNIMPAGAPFGGYKESGIGRETHKMLLDQYSEVKSILINMGEKTSGLYPKP